MILTRRKTRPSLGAAEERVLEVLAWLREARADLNDARQLVGLQDSVGRATKLQTAERYVNALAHVRACEECLAQAVSVWQQARVTHEGEKS